MRGAGDQPLACAPLAERREVRGVSMQLERRVVDVGLVEVEGLRIAVRAVQPIRDSARLGTADDRDLLAQQGGQCVADIIGAGIVPGGMEMMDRPAISAAEDFVHAGYPLDVEALLIVELDGPGVEVDHLIGRVEAIALQNGSTTCRVSTSEQERLTFWAGRKAAFPAVGRISPDYYCMDGTIPRKELPRVLAGMRDLSEQYGLGVANVFHAGDGNLHPLILYDANVPGELDKAEAFGADILRLCVKVGGVLTGEHGVGVEKRDLMGEMFSEADLDQQMRVKCAFDPNHLLNPGKVFPQLRRCAELGRMHVHRGQLAFPDIPRF